MSYQVEKDWTTAAGFRAVVTMGSMGFRCGYVGVPEGHPLHGAEYDAPCSALPAPADDEEVGKRGIIPLLCASADSSRLTSPDVVFDVHGGLTYSAGRDYPVPSDGLWWFGYDCGHAGDGRSEEYIAQRKAASPDSGDLWDNAWDEVVRDLAYCEAECESLARQIVERTVVVMA